MTETNPTSQPEPLDEVMDAPPETVDTIEDASQPDINMNVDDANNIKEEEDTEAIPQAVEARIPAKKDANLREFLNKMDDYAPIIPDAVTNYYLTLSGLPPPPQTPIQLTRLLSLATQKFIADIAADAYQYSRIRSSNTASNNPMGGGGPGVGGPAGAAAAGVGGAKEAHDKSKGVSAGVQRPGFGGGGQGATAQGRTVLTMEDLGMAVGEYGVNIKRGEFYR